MSWRAKEQLSRQTTDEISEIAGAWKEEGRKFERTSPQAEAA